jgi:hypothetical protein
MSHETVNYAGVIHCGHFIWEENMKKRNPLNLYNRTQFKPPPLLPSPPGRGAGGEGHCVAREPCAPEK